MGYIVFGCYCFKGIKDAVCVGSLGVVVYCVLINGLRGMIGWALANALIAIICGCAFRFISNIKHKYMRYILYVLCIVVSCFLGIIIVKSGVEWFLFKEPFVLRVIKNSYAFVADVIVMMLSVIVYKYISVMLKNNA
jgi:heme A synthase